MSRVSVWRVTVSKPNRFTLEDTERALHKALALAEITVVEIHAEMAGPEVATFDDPIVGAAPPGPKL